MNAINRMSPPQVGHASGNSSPTLAISLAQAIRDVSCEGQTVIDHWGSGSSQKASAPALCRREMGLSTERSPTSRVPNRELLPHAAERVTAAIDAIGNRVSPLNAGLSKFCLHDAWV
jgi:hypothetical protein